VADAAPPDMGVPFGFEPLRRDGLSRIGKLSTPHGTIETPALLPVLHPDRRRQVIPPSELRAEFGISGAISSAYILWRTPGLREAAERSGIHAVLGFDGPLMTDSGAFQQHAYGSVDAGPEEILAFQDRIRSDIATVLDIFVEPDADEATARAAVEETSRRAHQARAARRGLLAVPVQGGRFPELRFESARAGSEVGDLLAVGGVVPLLEQYRFADLARVLLAARPGIAPEKPVHLFGTGHPVAFAFAALFGVDLFDSAGYHKFARRGAVLFPDGTVPLRSIREAVCDCRACARLPLTEVARLPPEEQVPALARHNLHACATEIARVRQAIRDGSLWELVERRAAAHPALHAGLQIAVRGIRQFLPFEPESRPVFRWSSSLSTLRPAAIKYLARVRQWKAARGPFRAAPRVPLTPRGLSPLATRDAAGQPVWWECPTALGPVPVELTGLYPLGCWVGPELYDLRPETEHPESVDPDPGETEALRLERWTTRQLLALFEWSYGAEAAAHLGVMPFVADRSPRTGLLRSVRREGKVWFVLGPEGVLRPTWAAAPALLGLLPRPRGRVIVKEDAVPFVAEGRSLFSRFAGPADPALSPGASALLVDAEDHPLALGELLLAPAEIGRYRRGVAVRVLGHARSPEPPLPESEELADRID
jgi:7-cyano-7-deazaguanine tRNA-ribosyltransferase